jgi:hypothetical protein
MVLPTNVLQTVQTYQASELAYLLNSFAFINTANKKFKDFNNLEANLGDTVTFDLPPRYTTNSSLVATFQPSAQRVQSLTVDKAVNTAYAFSAQQFIFNVQEYMEKFGKSAVVELGSNIEGDVAATIVDNTYRFYGDGVTVINSYSQLADALAYFRNYGAVSSDTKGYLSDIAIPGIVNTGLSQFVIDRNEKSAMSWELGKFSNCDWYTSNLLPIHTAGAIGDGASAAVQTLTVVSVNDVTGANVTQITCTCDASLSGATGVLKAGDVAKFIDVAGKINMRYLTFNGHLPSANAVQMRVTADADASTTTVVISISPGLCWVAGNANQNINTPIVAGMKIKVMPSHRAGLITSGKALFLAMPRLPEEIPFPTANKVDSESGVSIRTYYGSLFGQNQRGFVHDAIWGKTLVPEYSMRVLFPL